MIITALVAGAVALGSAIAGAFATVTLGTIATAAVRLAGTLVISKLVANRANKSSVGAQDVGSRVQLGPATNNKLAPTYGTAFLAPTMTDAKITTDQKTMYYVFSFCEATTGTLSFGKVLWNGKEVTLGLGEYGANNKIISLTTNATPPQVDDTINGYAYIYGFINGSSSGVNTGGTSAITILQDAGIPVADRWTSTDTMTNTCFAIVKVIFNQDVQDVKSDPKLSVQITNTLTKPGMVLRDYMTDNIYGCGIDLANIDEPSLDALDVYSDETITYLPVGYPVTPAVTQPRYRIDGPVNTGDNCLSNLQNLVDACDSWLQYSELLGKWTIVMNKPYSGALDDLYKIDSSVLIGGIDINPIDLNQTYNSLEVQFPNSTINDQTGYKVVDMTTPGTAWYDPTLLSPNEPDNRLVIQYPQVNNYVRAVYLGVRRLLQSREDLSIVCNLDYSGIQVVAGDVVRVDLAEYGWGPLPDAPLNPSKLFRVSQVQETKTAEGFLGARITAFEYNGTIYGDNAIQDFVEEPNTGLSDPNIIGIPGTPIVTLNTLANSGAVTSFSVASTVPTSGSVLYMDFNYGNTSNTASHLLYKTVQSANGSPFSSGTTISIDVNDAPVGNYYLSTTARNDFAGRTSASSSLFNWNANLQANSVTFTNIQPEGFGFLSIDSWDLNIYNPAPFTGFNDLVTDPLPGVPCYLSGSAPPAGGAWPFVTGNSTTTAGYLANSTSAYNPYSASQLVISHGQQGWYFLNIYNLADPLDTTEALQYWNQWQITTDTANTWIQFCPFVKFATNPATKVQLPTQLTFDTLLYDTYPWTYNIVNEDLITGDASISFAGIAIRNNTPGANIYINSAAVLGRQVKLT
jgi:hypothetical protein